MTWLSDLAQDLRHGARMMRRNPGFAATAFVTLAVAIGANTAVFSVINAVMLRSLPYGDSARLTMVWTSVPSLHEDESATSLPNYLDWKAQTRSFESLAFYTNEDATLFDRSGLLDPERLPGSDVSPNFFSVLGMTPALGRTFSQPEAARGDRLVVLSNQLWRRRFGGSPSILGQMVDLDGVDFQVIGVMPGIFVSRPRTFRCGSRPPLQRGGGSTRWRATAPP